jgi:hypothetical protein
MTTHSGSCLCGAVSFDVTGALRPVIACHCAQCRKASGHHVAATSAPRDDVAVSGDVTWYASSPAARRGFCGTCGSNLFWDGPGVNLSIFAGAFDGDPGVRLAAHIFCDDKGSYYDLSDDLPKAGGEDPALTTQVPG